MKIGILGRGSIGMISTMQLIQELRNQSILDSSVITVIYDPDIPEVAVGEATTSKVPYILEDVLDLKFEDIIGTLGATKRKGTEFIWEEAHGTNFNIGYGSHGIHLDSAIFSKFILNKLLDKYPNIKTVEERIYSIKNRVINDKYKFDFIINSLGTPSKEELESAEYTTPPFETVNAVLLFQHKGRYGHQENSYAYYHKNGWMFGIPLAYRKAFGYLYNRNITSKTEALEDFSRILNEFPTIKNISEANTISLEWNYYYKNSIIKDGEIYLGNKLFFFEPAQALPIHFYYSHMEFILPRLIRLWKSKGIDTDDYLYTEIEESENKRYSIGIARVLDLIALNYVGRIDNPSNFWKTIGNDSKNFLKNSENFQTWIKSLEHHNKGYYPGYWAHDAELMKLYIDSLDIDIRTLSYIKERKYNHW